MGKNVDYDYHDSTPKRDIGNPFRHIHIFKKKNNDSHNFLNIHFIHISLNLLQSYDVTYIEDERRERKKENHKHTMNTCSHNNYLPTKCEQLVVWNIGREGKLKSVSHKYLHVLIQELMSATKLHDANY